MEGQDNKYNCWPLDGLCHKALCTVFELEVFDFDAVVYSLITATSIIFKHPDLLEELSELLNSCDEHRSCNDSRKRIVLVCLAVRVCMVYHPNFKFNIPKDVSNFEGILYLIKGLLQMGFVDSKETISEMQSLTLRLMILDSKQNCDASNIATIMDKCKKYVNEPDVLLENMEGIGSNALGHKSYIQTMLKKIAVINSTLSKPFLVKLVNRVKECQQLSEQYCNISENCSQQFISLAYSFRMNTNNDLMKLQAIERSKLATVVVGSDAAKKTDSNASTSVPKCDSNQCSNTATSLLPQDDSAVSQLDNSDRSVTSDLHATTTHTLPNILQNPRSQASDNDASSLSSMSSSVSRTVQFSRNWTPELDAYIIAGVQKFGRGSWQTIRQHLPFPSGKKSTQIKDRWRTMVKHKLVETNSDNQIISFDDNYCDFVKIANGLLETKCKSSDDIYAWTANTSATSVAASNTKNTLKEHPATVPKMKTLKKSFTRKQHYRKVIF